MSAQLQKLITAIHYALADLQTHAETLEAGYDSLKELLSERDLQIDDLASELGEPRESQS
jgi:hypothetical protein